MADKVKLCARCEQKLKPGKNRCECGWWNWNDGPADALPGDGSILLEDIVSSDVDRMYTGPWDKCFGWPELDEGVQGTPGIVRGSVNLIGGSPGAGKSTLFLQISEGVITNYSLEVLYLSAEEQLPQIRSRADRLHIKTSRKLRFVDLRKGSANLAAILQKYQFGLLILDSLKAMAESMEDCISICKIIKEFATIQHAPALISQHVNKGHEVAGLMGLQHEVDATMTFFPDVEAIENAGQEAPRVLQTLKNRNGRAFVEQEFEMTARGLVPVEEDDEEAA